MSRSALNLLAHPLKNECGTERLNKSEDSSSVDGEVSQSASNTTR